MTGRVVIEGEANDAADQSDLPPIELARQWAAHRKPEYD